MGQTGAEVSQQHPSDVNSDDRAQFHANPEHPSCKKQLFKIPKSLIGAKSIAQVIIKGEQFNSLLYTGSQVTTIPQSFYVQYLSEQEIKPLYNLLEVEGANGQAMPYLGYVETSVTFPKHFLGVPIKGSTLALVVPDVRATSESSSQ